MVIGSLENGGLFSIQIEGAQKHKIGLQIKITGTEGVLRIINPHAFENKHDNLIQGMKGYQTSLASLPVSAEYNSLSLDHLDARGK